MKTIFNTYIEIESQEQADRLKQVCVDNGLIVLESDESFIFDKTYNCFCCNSNNEFFIRCFIFIEQKYKITEPEWMELLTKYKEEQCKKTID